MKFLVRRGRKRSGIRQELKAKIEDWLKSIDDKRIRDMIAKDAIVTGGSIASMLMGERVNDYDIYFRNKETVIEVARYYVKQFVDNNKILSNNGYVPEVRVKDDRVRIYMRSAGVAGEDQGEYEYFEFTEDGAVEFMATLLKEKRKKKGRKPKYRPICLTDNAITLSDDIQIVIRFYGEPKEIHKNYDFVHCTCSWDHANEVLDLPAPALEAMLSRTLVYQGSLYPVASIFRVRKFLDRDWRINAGQLLKIMAQISELDLSDFNVLQEQLIGVDVAYMHEILQAIASEKPDKVDSTYIANLVDRIFE